MSEFENVNIVKKANIYFEGKVSSRTILFKDGTRKTLGIMLPGNYEFGTSDREIMEIQTGELEILLPGDCSWRLVKSGERFEVPANAKFKLNVKAVTDYVCIYYQ